jgi:hypothetical protein
MKTNPVRFFAVSLLLGLLMSHAAPVVAAEEKRPQPYPLKTCLVTDNALGSMGKILTKSYRGQEVKFCCKPCIKKFDAAPARYLQKLPKP